MDDPISNDRASCIFCKIVAGDSPSWPVYENKNIFAFLDIHPVSAGHVLVISKKHYDTPLETPNEILSKMILAGKHIAPALSRATGATGFNITFNNGTDAGQVVMHTHLHIIPRNKSDGLKLWESHDYSKGEQEKVAQKIRGEL